MPGTMSQVLGLLLFVAVVAALIGGQAAIRKIRTRPGGRREAVLRDWRSDRYWLSELQAPPGEPGLSRQRHGPPRRPHRPALPGAAAAGGRG